MNTSFGMALFDVSKHCDSHYTAQSHPYTPAELTDAVLEEEVSSGMIRSPKHYTQVMPKRLAILRTWSVGKVLVL
jgi:hypothetical protein